jgi:hypothetical protein
MAYVVMPPPSVEEMLEEFVDWMAQHAYAKISVQIEYSDGTSQSTVIDRRIGKRGDKTPNGLSDRLTEDKGE